VRPRHLRRSAQLGSGGAELQAAAALATMCSSSRAGSAAARLVEEAPAAVRLDLRMLDLATVAPLLLQ
jgi:hypothetical protein